VIECKSFGSFHVGLSLTNIVSCDRFHVVADTIPRPFLEVMVIALDPNLTIYPNSLRK
jgi:hypothetical protein